MTYRGIIVSMTADVHQKLWRLENARKLLENRTKKNIKPEFYIHSKYPSNMKAQQIHFQIQENQEKFISRRTVSQYITKEVLQDEGKC